MLMFYDGNYKNIKRTLKSLIITLWHYRILIVNFPKVLGQDISQLCLVEQSAIVTLMIGNLVAEAKRKDEDGKKALGDFKKILKVVFLFSTGGLVSYLLRLKARHLKVSSTE